WSAGCAVRAALSILVCWFLERAGGSRFSIRTPVPALQYRADREPIHQFAAAGNPGAGRSAGHYAVHIGDSRIVRQWALGFPRPTRRMGESDAALEPLSAISNRRRKNCRSNIWAERAYGCLPQSVRG